MYLCKIALYIQNIRLKTNTNFAKTGPFVVEPFWLKRTSKLVVEPLWQITDDLINFDSKMASDLQLTLIEVYFIQ